MEKQVNIHALLVKAQMEFEAVVFDKFNPHFKNKYASLAAIKNAIQPALNKYGFFVSQPCEWKESGDIVLFTRLVHESGAVIELASCLIKREGKTDQQFGGAITYQRRYQISSALFLFAEEDDDGEAAVGRSTPTVELKKPSTTLNKESLEQIRTAMKDHPNSKEAGEAILKHFGKKISADIEQKDFPLVMQMINESKESA